MICRGVQLGARPLLISVIMMPSETLDIPITDFAKSITNAKLEGLTVLARALERYAPEREDDFQLAIDAALGMFSQSEFAAEFKVSAGTISRWRTGTSCPPSLVREVIVSRIRDMLLKRVTQIKSEVLHLVPIDKAEPRDI
jgi:hypothetical protein